jgi:hypothetical protein
MRQPTIHQMREESFIEEKSRKSKRFSIYIANGLQTFRINGLNLIFKKISTLVWNDN